MLHVLAKHALAGAFNDRGCSDFGGHFRASIEGSAGEWRLLSMEVMVNDISRDRFLERIEHDSISVSWGAGRTKLLFLARASKAPRPLSRPEYSSP
jgi:hypothetical protein